MDGWMDHVTTPFEENVLWDMEACMEALASANGSSWFEWPIFEYFM